MSIVTYLRPANVYLKGSTTLSNFVKGDTSTTVSEYDTSTLAFLKREGYVTAEVAEEPKLSAEELRAQRLAPKTPEAPATPPTAPTSAAPAKPAKGKGKIARAAADETKIETPAPEQPDPDATDLGNGIKDAPAVERTELEQLTGGEVTSSPINPDTPPEATETESDGELAAALFDATDDLDVAEKPAADAPSGN